MKPGPPGSFAAQLKALREAAGYTQEELAAIAGLSVHGISALERGERRRPHVETVRALSAALDLNGPIRDTLFASARAPCNARAVDELGGAALPMPLTPLLGREADMEVLTRWLADPAARLITLVGPGGVGKTRLALELARASADEDRYRVLFVGLAAVRSSAYVAPAIAEALGVLDDAPLDLPKRARLACEGQPTLLVIDNFEHVLDMSTLVVHLLMSVPTLRVLATSRAPLRVRGEREYAVGPLALDADFTIGSLDDLARSAALRLFVERARDVRPDFEVTALNAQTVSAICRRLDALPLALELAAPWLKVLTAEDLLRRLTNDVLLPTVGPRDLPARQQTINATVAWSYQLLAPDEQRMFRRLGVVPGRFSIEAAAAVLVGAGDSASAGDEALHATVGLIDKSLLVQTESWVAGRPLFQMLETVRAYAALELAASGERDDALEGLAQYATKEAAAAAEKLVGPEQVEWLDRVREDLETYRAALTCLIDQKRGAEAADIAYRLLFFWIIRGHAAEGQRWYDRIAKMRALPPDVESKVQLGSGALRYAKGEVDAARPALMRACALAGPDDDALITAQAENLLGRVEHSLGRIETAREYYGRSLERFRAARLAWGIGNALTGLAAVEIATGDSASAERLLDEAAAVLRPVGPWFLALSLYVRAMLSVRVGNADGTIAIVREGLTLIRGLHDNHAFVFVLGPLALAAMDKGEHAWAARILGARDVVSERTRATFVVRQSLDNIIGLAERDVRECLGPERWAEAYAEGRQASIDALLEDIDRVLSAAT
jgi:predicted ATPase/DNA-binding XRE family transcriptional regulator